MTVFFTSDTHFGDASVIRNCNRPFASPDEMDEALTALWNAHIRAGDTVYHLGDFCLPALKDAAAYLERLNGEVHLIQGNHDWHTVPRNAGHFASVSLIKEITVSGRQLVLCHYPMREWNGCYRGSWHLYGHVHGRLNHLPHGHSMDVGIDSNEFRPWTFDEVAEILSDRVSPFDPGRPPPFRKTIRAPSLPGNP
jgi:calcineurin-like phosphoesterase family protein